MKKLIILLLLVPLTIVTLAKSPVVSIQVSAEGTAVFQIKMKGSKAAIRITREGETQTVSEMTFEGDKGRNTFTFTANLAPGKYNWYFTDDLSNDKNGTIVVEEKVTTQVQVLQVWEMDHSAKELLQPEERSTKQSILFIWEKDNSSKESLQPEERISAATNLPVWQRDMSSKDMLEPVEII